MPLYGKDNKKITEKVKKDCSCPSSDLKKIKS
jgi:hypothetical protein